MFRFWRKSAADQEERRREQRAATFYFADICDEDGTPVAKATVREISDQGAFLRLNPEKEVPQSLIIQSYQMGLNKGASLKWRSGGDIGVEFGQELEPAR